MRRPHTHTCAKCGGEFHCDAPLVADHDAPNKVCIVVFEEGDEQLCDDCEEQGRHVPPQASAKVH